MYIQLSRYALKQPSYIHTLALSICLVILFAAGCATAPQQEVKKTVEFAWPSASSQPVIKYLHSFRSSEKFTEESGSNWKDELLGRKEDKNFATLQTPYGVNVDNSGRVYVADTRAFGLSVFDFVNEDFLSVGAFGPGEMQQVVSSANDKFDRIYAVDIKSQNVFVYSKDGTFLKVLGADGEFEKPVGIAIDDDRERIYVSDTGKHHIAVFNFEGKRVSTIGDNGEDIGSFNYPLNIAVGNNGRLHVVDSMNFRVQVFDPDTEEAIVTIGEQGKRPGQFMRPKGVAVDSDNNIYVSDAAFSNVQIFNGDGELLMAFGKAGYNPGGFSFPAGMTFDQQDRLYVADQVNQRVQVFQYLGKPDLEEMENETLE